MGSMVPPGESRIVPQLLNRGAARKVKYGMLVTLQIPEAFQWTNQSGIRCFKCGDCHRAIHCN
jgi:hypothetical protein